MQVGGRSLGPGLGSIRLGPTSPSAPPRHTRDTLVRLIHCLKPHRGVLAANLVLTAAGTLAALSAPILIAKAVDTVSRGAADGSRTGLGLGIWVAALAAAYGAAFLATWVQGLTLIAVAQDVARRLRDRLFAHLQRLPLRYFDSRPDGDTLSRFSNDLEALSAALSQNAANLFSSALQAAGALCLMAALDLRLCAAALLPAPVGLWAARRLARKTRAHFAAQQAALGEMGGLAGEMIGGLPVVQAFGREAGALRDFAAVNARLTRAGVKAQIYSGVVPPMMGFMNNLGFACASLAGAWLILHGEATAGLLAAFTLLSRQFTRPLSELASQFNLLQGAVAGAERVFDVLDLEPEPDLQPALHAPFPRPSEPPGSVVFDDVRFAYSPETQVLRGVSLEAAPGSLVALVGATGSGKTTLVNLLARFYDVDGGGIRIGGKDVRSMDRAVLRRKVGIVLQDAHLFGGTVRENLLFGNPTAGEAALREAARLAHAEPFILRLPEGYDTVIDGSGSGLSQGEKQLTHPGPRAAGRSGHPGARRGHLQRGHPHRASHPGGVAGAPEGEDLPGHRPSSLHHPRRGLHRRPRPGTGGGTGNPCRTPGEGRSLSGFARQPICRRIVPQLRHGLRFLTR